MEQKLNGKPIGIFDSGIGGLTVARAVWQKLPQESFIYLGDTARVPYGTRGKEVICRFALQLAKFLLKRKVKALVVACNTISSTCLDKIRSLSPVPVIDAVTPAVEEAVKTTKTQVVGVVGTNATIGSKVYEKKMKVKNPKIKVLTKACPLFVPLAEEGLSDHEVAYLMAKDYLKVFSQTKVDTLVLGCTHYPLLEKAIRKTLDNHITLIDSAHPIAETLEKILREKNLLSNGLRPTYEFFVTDAPERVSETTRRFFGGSLPGKVKKITLK